MLQPAHHHIQPLHVNSYITIKSIETFTHTTIQNMMKMFHSAMKIRKYRRLSRNSLMLSPERQTPH